MIMPDALLDEVTALVEWPAVYAGTFDAAFLAVPQECLILTMKENQKYFALADADGKLTNRFLVVSNIGPADPAAIVAGQRARGAPAPGRCEVLLRPGPQGSARSARAEARKVVYHGKLGTQGERVERMRVLAAADRRRRSAPMPPLADRAALLAKADLVTDMVGEFPELQGIMGGYYAQHDGEPAEVAEAIEQHYWPRFAGDALPRRRRRAGARARRQARDARRHVRHRPAADRRQGSVRAAPRTRSA